MKKYDLTVNVFVEKHYKGIEAENRDDAAAIAIKKFKDEEYQDFDVNEADVTFIKEVS